MWNSIPKTDKLDKVLEAFKDVNDVAFLDNSFWKFRRDPIAVPTQSQETIDELFDDADLLSAPFQDLISCWMNGSSNIADFCDEEFEQDFSFGEEMRSLGKFNVGPIKQITRSIAKIHRSYKGKFNLLTDLVRAFAADRISFSFSFSFSFFLFLLISKVTELGCRCDAQSTLKR